MRRVVRPFKSALPRRRRQIAPSWRHARSKIARHGQLSLIDIQLRRTVTRPRAPIFRSLFLIVPHCAWAISVPARPIGRSSLKSILEVADVVAVNKAGLERIPAAREAARAVSAALRYARREVVSVA